MFVRLKKKSNGKTAVQIVESVRRGDKVSQKIIRHLGQGENEKEINELKKLAESICCEMKDHRQPTLPLFKPEQFYGPAGKKRLRRSIENEKVYIKDIREHQRIIEGPGEVFGALYNELGFNTLISGTKKDSQWNDILATCLIARLTNPQSKRRSAALLEEDFGILLPLEKIYRMMDVVAKNEESIKKRVAKTTLSLFPEEVDVLYFDVTTLHFESQKSDELKDFGFSKNGKFNEVQLVLALVCTKEGLPITYELYPGNTFEGSTLIKSIRKLKSEYNVANVLLVADRGMCSAKNLEAMREENIKYIVAAKLRSRSKAWKERILLEEDFKAASVCDELHWVKEYKDDNEDRLLVSYSRARAECDAKKTAKLRERILLALGSKKKGSIKKGLRSAWKKYVKTEGSLELDEDKFAEDELWHGIHGVITNDSEQNASQILARYRGLWQIEEAFRISKHDLKMRPIFHWSPSRIRAHISICFLAYAIAKQAIFRLKTVGLPMSFEQLRNELLHVQASIMVDTATKKKFVVPSTLSARQKTILQTFAVKRQQIAYGIA